MKVKLAADVGGRRIKADLKAQSPNNSYAPPMFYDDINFLCRICKAECVWTAKQQQQWYEKLGGAIQSTAIHCLACRKRLRSEKNAQRQRMLESAIKNPAFKAKVDRLTINKAQSEPSKVEKVAPRNSVQKLILKFK